MACDRGSFRVELYSVAPIENGYPWTEHLFHRQPLCAEEAYHGWVFWLEESSHGLFSLVERALRGSLPNGQRRSIDLKDAQKASERHFLHIPP